MKLAKCLVVTDRFTVRVDTVRGLKKKQYKDSGNTDTYHLALFFKNNEMYVSYSSKEERDKDYNLVNGAMKMLYGKVDNER